jgi:CO dehydrogenase/acetyl-CoA synthase epsilon subunit
MVMEMVPFAVVAVLHRRGRRGLMLVGTVAVTLQSYKQQHSKCTEKLRMKVQMLSQLLWPATQGSPSGQKVCEAAHLLLLQSASPFFV